MEAFLDFAERAYRDREADRGRPSPAPALLTARRLAVDRRRAAGDGGLADDDADRGREERDREAGQNQPVGGDRPGERRPVGGEQRRPERRPPVRPQRGDPQTVPERLERPAVRHRVADPPADRRHRRDGQDRPDEKHLREAEHRQRDRGLRRLRHRGRDQQPEPQRRRRGQQQGHERGPVVAGVGQSPERPQHDQEQQVDQREQRKQDRDLGEHIGRGADAGEPLAAQHAELTADLQQPVGEAEEEAAERHPEQDHHGRGRTRMGRVERAGAEQHQEHEEHHDRGADEDREGERGPGEHVGVPPGEQQPLPERATDRRVRSASQREARPSLAETGAGRSAVGAAMTGCPGRIGGAVKQLVDLLQGARAEVVASRGGRAEERQPPPGGQHRHLVAPVGVGRVMRGQDHGGAGLGEPAKRPHQLGAASRVEAGRRLVEEEQRRPGEQFGRDRGPLALAAGQLADGDSANGR